MVNGNLGVEPFTGTASHFRTVNKLASSRTRPKTVCFPSIQCDVMRYDATQRNATQCNEVLLSENTHTHTNNTQNTKENCLLSTDSHKYYSIQYKVYNTVLFHKTQNVMPHVPRCGAAAHVIKNWHPLVFGPLLAMDKSPGPLCLWVLRFSSGKDCP